MAIPLKEIDFIGQYRVSNTVCDELIDLYKKVPETKEDSPIFKGPGKIGQTSPVINLDVKDSTDVSFISECIYKPHLFGEEFNEYLKTLHNYFIELSKCLSLYTVDHHFIGEALSDSIGMFANLKIVEGTNIQHYKPGGGYKQWHFERGGNVPPMCLRQLVFMTYLNDVPEGGTEFYYQNKKIEAQKCKTLIWPSDFTHTHRGVISNTHEKYIITGWYNYEPQPL